MSNSSIQDDIHDEIQQLLKFQTLLEDIDLESITEEHSFVDDTVKSVFVNKRLFKLVQ